jgi:hypothetical protein
MSKEAHALGAGEATIAVASVGVGAVGLTITDFIHIHTPMAALSFDFST